MRSDYSSWLPEITPSSFLQHLCCYFIGFLYSVLRTVVCVFCLWLCNGVVLFFINFWDLYFPWSCCWSATFSDSVHEGYLWYILPSHWVVQQQNLFRSFCPVTQSVCSSLLSCDTIGLTKTVTTINKRIVSARKERWLSFISKNELYYQTFV